MQAMLAEPDEPKKRRPYQKPEKYEQSVRFEDADDSDASE